MLEYEHVDYPHWPGDLWDCLGCMIECFCDNEGFMCIKCTMEICGFGEVGE